MYKFKNYSLLCTFALIFASWSAWAEFQVKGGAARVSRLSLESFLLNFENASEALQAADRSIEAAKQKRRAGDLSLSPSLSLRAQQVDDRKPQNFGSAFSITRTQSKESSVSLAKLFTTGTQVSITGLAGESSTTGLLGGISSEATQGYSSLGFNLSQSLWKAGFGRAIGFRHQREAILERIDIAQAQLKKAQALIEAENVFWDWSYQLIQVEKSLQSLQRAEKLLGWIRQRQSNGISDRSDVVGMEVLVQSRQLSVSQARLDLVSTEDRIRDLLKISEILESPQMDSQFVRRLEQLPAGQGTELIRIDSYLPVLQAQVARVLVDEVADNLRPDVLLTASYKTNPTDSNMSSAIQNLGVQTNPTTQVGVQMLWTLDTSVKESARSQARAEALSAQWTAEKKRRESLLAWQDLQRRHEDLKSRYLRLQELSRLQQLRAQLERAKLNQGRVITSTVIQAEQEAADGELSALKIWTETRKLESQARLFIRTEEAL